MAINQYYSSDDISTYEISDDSNISSVIKYNNNGIFGIPYQFLPSVDARLENSELGHKYTEKIVSRMPLLFLVPCKQKFMEGFNRDDRETVLQALASGQGLGELGDTLSTFGKYYTTEFNYPDYIKHVNNMCSEVAIFLGIGDEYVKINGKRVKIKNIQWSDVKNEDFRSYFNASNSAVFYVDGLDSISDNFGNSTTESSLASTINGFSDQANEIKFLLGGDSALAQMINSTGDAVSSVSSALSGTVTTMFGGMLGDLAKTGVNTVLSGGKIVFPKIWQDFSFDRSYNFSIKLRSPDHDSVSIFFNVLVPYLHLLAMVLPVGMKIDPNGYTTPLLCKAYCKGMFNIDMGLITSMSCTRGASAQWNDDGLPTQMDIDITIEDLYSCLFMTNLENWSYSVAAVKNTSMLDFLANLSGLNIADEEFGRRTAMLTYLLGSNAERVPSNLWNRFDNSVNNMVANLYHSL